MTPDELVIRQTKKWITDIVIGCNFCPFAAKEVKRNTIHYQVENTTEIEECLDSFLKECIRLDENEKIETSLLILPEGFKSLDNYLKLVSHAENILKKKNYEGIYQVASFHPLYCFANSPFDDAANFTNRSPCPMLHLLREERIEQALAHYPLPERIPANNIDFAREKGYSYMKMLRDSTLEI